MSEQDPQSKVTLQPEFIPSVAGQIFTLTVLPEAMKASDRVIIFFPPFAEEMNKARRMVALQARALAREGYTVVIPDLYGTGDSFGDFSEARMDIWLGDISTLIANLKQQGYKQFIFWGLRLGALMLMQAVQKKLVEVSHIIFWQPVLKGEVMVTQFLRLRLAADMMAAGEKITTKDMRQALQNGEAVEVAGYNLMPDLVRGIDSLNLNDVTPPNHIPIDWIEVIPSEERPIPVVNQRLAESWKELGIPVTQTKVVGEPFWTTIEIAEVPELVQLTTRSITSSSVQSS